MKKTTKAEFNRFKKSFMRWQERLGLTQYRINFFHKSIDLRMAQIQVDEDAKFAQVTFTNEYDEEFPPISPELSAKHEALHLLINRLEWLARCRYVRPDDFYEENEAIVVRLEKVLP